MDKKEYHVTIKMTFVQNVEASSVEEAKKVIKETFYDEYGLIPSDKEIVEVEEQFEVENGSMIIWK